jgi:hypothetical protein
MAYVVDRVVICDAFCEPDKHPGVGGRIAHGDTFYGDPHPELQGTASRRSLCGC